MLKILYYVWALLLIASTHAFEHTFPITILHTNDLHSGFLGPSPHVDPEFLMARLATAIQTIRNHSNSHVFLVDAGDWFEGSLFHTIGPLPSTVSRFAPELEFFDLLQYDAVVMGNHDFNVGAATDLAAMIEKYEQSSGHRLPLLSSNFRFLGPDCEILKKRLNETWKIVEVQGAGGAGLRVGFFGLYSPDSAFLSAGMRSCVEVVGFDDESSNHAYSDYFSYAENVMHHLQHVEHVDLAVAVTHMGEPEDEDLMKYLALKNLSPHVIISSHTHSHYSFAASGTIVSQAKCCAEHLGVITLEVQKSQAPDIPAKVFWVPRKLPFFDPPRLRKFQIDPLLSKFEFLDPLSIPIIGSDIPIDKQVHERIETWRLEIDRVFASAFGFSFSDPIFSLHQDVLRIKDPGCTFFRDVATGILHSLRHFYDPSLDVYITGTSTMRSDFLTKPTGAPTPYTFSDIFLMLPIGKASAVMPDSEKELAGTPILHFYLTVKDLHTIMEVFFTYFRFFHSDALVTYSASLNFDLRPQGIPLWNQISNIRLTRQRAANRDLIHVAMPLIFVEYVDRVSSFTYGIVDPKFRDSSGTPVTFHDLQHRFVLPRAREYTAFANYLKTSGTFPLP
eukprot:ANDGO_06710.mRNA.1 Protein 5NUC